MLKLFEKLSSLFSKEAQQPEKSAPAYFHATVHSVIPKDIDGADGHCLLLNIDGVDSEHARPAYITHLGKAEMIGSLQKGDVIKAHAIGCTFEPDLPFPISILSQIEPCPAGTSIKNEQPVPVGYSTTAINGHDLRRNPSHITS